MTHFTPRADGVTAPTFSSVRRAPLWAIWHAWCVVVAFSVPAIAECAAPGATYQPGPSLKTAKRVYQTGESIVVRYQDLPPGMHRIVLCLKSESPRSWGVDRQNTSGNASDTCSFTAPTTTGVYEVRVLEGSNYSVLAQWTFLVGQKQAPPSASIHVAKNRYTTTDLIDVQYENPGSGGEVICLCTANANVVNPYRGTICDKTNLTSGKGSHAFPPIATPGNYEARFYSLRPGGTFVMENSASFTVSVPHAVALASVKAGRNAYTTTDPIVAKFTNPGNGSEVICICPAGATITNPYRGTVDDKSNLPPGRAQHSFSPITVPGNYEVRFYSMRPSGGFHLEDSDTFTVTASRSAKLGQVVDQLRMGVTQKGYVVVQEFDRYVQSGQSDVVKLGVFNAGYDYAVAGIGDPDACILMTLSVTDGSGNRFTKDESTDPRAAVISATPVSSTTFDAHLHVNATSSPCQCTLLVIRRPTPAQQPTVLQQPRVSVDDTRRQFVFTVPGTVNNSQNSQAVLTLYFKFRHPQSGQWVDGPGSSEDGRDRRRWRQYRDSNGFAIAQRQISINGPSVDVGGFPIAMPYGAFNLEETNGRVNYQISAVARLTVNGQFIDSPSVLCQLRW